jgi:putative ABC transport system ATP-binding protein
MLELEDVTKSYRTPSEVVVAVREASIVVEPGEVVAVMGPSGSGKSTLLLLIAGLLLPDDGSIRFNGRDIGKMSERERTEYLRSEVGFVYQDYNLLPGASALENVAFPLYLNRVRWRDAKTKAAVLLERMDLAHRANFRPARLSGGEQQRVAVASALAIKPSLVLADEPTGNLDTARGNEVLSALRELSQERDSAVILVTHDVRAASYADRICDLKDGYLQERSGNELQVG